MKATTIRRVRQLHHYRGVFFAPAILLFAVSGAPQTFHLHQSARPGSAPPRWIVWLASVYKDQRLPPPGGSADRHDHASGAGNDQDHDSAAAPDSAHRGARENNRPGGHTHDASGGVLRWFVAALAAALTMSTLLGMLVALDQRRARGATLLLPAAGTVVPRTLLYG